MGYLKFEGEFLNGKKWNGKGIEYDKENKKVFESKYLNGEIVEKIEKKEKEEKESDANLVIEKDDIKDKKHKKEKENKKGKKYKSNKNCIII